jgi:hypothetical protein
MQNRGVARLLKATVMLLIAAESPATTCNVRVPAFMLLRKTHSRTDQIIASNQVDNISPF